MDKAIVEEFLGNWDGMVSEATHIKSMLGVATPQEQIEQFPRGETAQRVTHARIGQDFSVMRYCLRMIIHVVSLE